MITRIGMAPRRPGLSIEGFQAHWRGVHAQMVSTLKGLRRNWQSHALLRDGEPLLPWTGFDACSEMDFDDLRAMHAAFTPDNYPPGLKEDSEYLIDKSKAAVVFAERVHVGGRIDLNSVRLLTFMRRASGRTTRELHESLRSLGSSDARARELFLCLDGEGDSRIASSFDAVDVQWFEQPSHAERYVASAEAREHRHQLAHLVRGVERVIARVRVVV